MDYEAAPHNYMQRVPQDRFTKLMATNPALDASGELPLVKSLLQLLKIPPSSQLLVYSATSLQSGIINPRNPRALYFNEDTSLGFIPGGRIEIASLDPEAGMVFYIFDRLNPSAGLPRFTRSDKCTNCHADSPSKGLPGLVVDSVGVNMTGGSLVTYRHDLMGHTVPLEERFGGWHLTGGISIPNSRANLVAQLEGDNLSTIKNPPGTFFNLKRYLLPTSDILPHLVHEHQVAFINKVIESIYLVRENRTAQFDAFAREFAEYILFKNEAKLPPTGIQGDPAYASDFQNAAASPGGKALREFDLKTRLFKHPFSYLVLTGTWQMVPSAMRKRIYTHLKPATKADPALERLLQTELKDW